MKVVIALARNLVQRESKLCHALQTDPLATAVKINVTIARC